MALPLMATIGVSAPATPVAAQNPDVAWMDCKGLWYQRNTRYHHAGYCFKSARGKRTFGNAGCSRNQRQAWAALDAGDKRTVRLIQKEERRKGC